MSNIIIASEQNEELFLNLLDEKIDHYIGFHNHCQPQSAKYCSELKNILSEEALHTFLVKLLYVSYILENLV
jgi:hypothetical protein